MSEIQIRAAIVDALKSVGAVNVFDREPRIEQLDEVINQLTDPNVHFIEFWTVQRRRSTPHTAETDFGFVPQRCIVRWFHEFEVMLAIGYLKSDGDRIESEYHFQNRISETLYGLAHNRSYGNSAWNSFAPLGLIDTRTKEIGGIILSHQALFGITLIEDQWVEPS